MGADGKHYVFLSITNNDKVYSNNLHTTGQLRLFKKKVCLHHINITPSKKEKRITV
jgi:hypothetical protein